MTDNDHTQKDTASTDDQPTPAPHTGPTTPIESAPSALSASAASLPTTPTARLDAGAENVATTGSAQFPGSRMDWFPMAASDTRQAPLGTETAAGAQPGGAGTTPPTLTPKRRPARFGTILWGVLLLTFAAAVVSNAVSNIALDPVTWIISALIGVGAILVIAGIAAAIRR